MTDKNNESKTDKPKLTLSLKGVTKADLEKKINDKKVVKNTLVVEGLDNKNISVSKSKLEPVKQARHLADNQREEGDKNNLTEKEFELRKQALEKAKLEKQERKDDPLYEKEVNQLIMPVAVTKKTSTVTKFNKEIKENNNMPITPKVFKDEKVEEAEESIDPAKEKKSPVKRKEKNELIRTLKSVSIEDELEEEILEELNEEVYEKEVAGVPVVREQAVEVSIKRVGKTKKDRRNRNSYINTVKHTVKLKGNISIKDLAKEIKAKTKFVIDTLTKLGQQDVKEYSEVDENTAALFLEEVGFNYTISAPDEEITKLYAFEEKEENMEVRPPIVTIMGHVDHGKTSLLDYIKKTKVVATESGGITQHIGAYQVTTGKGQKITFIDTPGHEAFSEMRARGAVVTDIIVIVVAADDGIKPQTVEVINHAKLSNVPIMIAINKMDKPEANPQKVRTDLLQYNIVVEELGGDVLATEISALKGTGVDKLLENILLVAEMLDLKANKKVPAKGTIIEAKIEKGIGLLASVIIQSGTLKIGNHFVSGTATGKVRAIVNDLGKNVKEAEPSTPVEISGFSGDVAAGDDFLVVKAESDAEKIAEFRRRALLSKNNDGSSKEEELSDVDFLIQSMENQKTYLPIILKADVHGSKEAIINAISKIKNNEVEIKVIHSAIGQINESDILMAKTAKALIFGFNVRANNKAKDLAKAENIEIRYHSIIYNLLDDVKNSLSGLLNPDLVETILGYAEVREVFNITKVGKVAGCYVKEGVIKKSMWARLIREGVVIHDGLLSQLKRFKDDVKEVKQGYDCGIAFNTFHDIIVGDNIECYEKKEILRKID